MFVCSIWSHLDIMPMSFHLVCYDFIYLFLLRQNQVLSQKGRESIIIIMLLCLLFCVRLTPMEFYLRRGVLCYDVMPYNFSSTVYARTHIFEGLLCRLQIVSGQFFYFVYSNQ